MCRQGSLLSLHEFRSIVLRFGSSTRVLSVLSMSRSSGSMGIDGFLEGCHYVISKVFDRIEYCLSFLSGSIGCSLSISGSGVRSLSVKCSDEISNLLNVPSGFTYEYSNLGTGSVYTSACGTSIVDNVIGVVLLCLSLIESHGSSSEGSLSENVGSLLCCSGRVEQA